MTSEAEVNNVNGVSCTSDSSSSQSNLSFKNLVYQSDTNFSSKENANDTESSGKYTKVDDTVEYRNTPTNIKEMVSAMFDDLRNILADRIAEDMFQQKLGNVEKITSPVSNSSSETHPSNILGALWEENRNLRFLLCRRYLNFLVTPTTKGKVNTLSTVKCDCWSFFKNSIALLDYLAHFETQKWIEQFTACDKERERLTLSLIRLTNRLAQTEAVIRRDPILSGAFHFQIADFTMGNVVTQMRNAYAQLAVAQVLNKELESQLEIQRSLNRKYREELFDLRQKVHEIFITLYSIFVLLQTKEFFINFKQHASDVTQESSEVHKYSPHDNFFSKYGMEDV